MPTTSPNMNLIVPIASTGVTGSGDPGPGYAQNISNDMTNIIDSHDHSSGKGVQVTPAGLNINQDLSVINNNVTNVRAIRFTSQSSVLSGVGDFSEIYVFNNAVWFNNSAGIAIQLGATGPTGPAGSNISSILQATAIMQSSGLALNDYLYQLNTIASGSPTGTKALLNVASGVVSVTANVLGNDGQSGYYNATISQGFYNVASGYPVAIGPMIGPTGYNTNTASGWGCGFSYTPTGAISPYSLSVSVSTPSAIALGQSGTVKWSVYATTNKLSNP